MADSSKKPKEETALHVVTTSSGNIHIREPKGKTNRRKPKIIVLVEPEATVKKQVTGFVGFLRERAVVGVAVAFVVATQVQVVIKQLLDSVINPLFYLLFGGKHLQNQSVVLHFHGREATITWGVLVYDLVDFFFVILSIYVIIKLFKLDKLDKKPD